MNWNNYPTVLIYTLQYGYIDQPKHYDQEKYPQPIEPKGPVLFNCLRGTRETYVILG